jgi:hypothetical protein
MLDFEITVVSTNVLSSTVLRHVPEKAGFEHLFELNSVLSNVENRNDTLSIADRARLL